jgi:EAL domain-containing protein (putative c-di-GMP-specific phosphodiesterase class I)
LRDLGVRLVLDDFGTGYSSLSYLKHLPLDTIKIDRSFVAGLSGVTDRSIVEAVVALARGLRIGVVAEGIETDVQRRILRDIGCDVGQGYLFSRPLSADDATRLVLTRRLGSMARPRDPSPGAATSKPARSRAAVRPRPALRAS